MKKLLTFSLLFLVIASCRMGVDGNGNVMEDERKSGDFDRISVSGAFDIFIRPGSENEVLVVTDQNLQEHIKTEVRNGVLHVSTKEHLGRYKKLELRLTMENFNGASLSGACELESNGRLKGDEVDLDFSGAVEADMELICQSLNVDMSGASELTMSGKAKSVDYDMSGACEIEAVDFETQNCRVDISGAGEADLFVTERLIVDVSGAAEVRYRGNPSEVTKDISGAASVKPFN